MKTYRLNDYAALGDFLHEQEAATIAVPFNNDGDIHAASLVYYHTEQPLAFYFVTSTKTTKARLLQTCMSIPCAVVVGTVKNVDFTLQMHGTLSKIVPGADVVDAYYAKRGNRHDDIADPVNTFLVFRPTWARFTGYSKDYQQFMLALP